MTTPERNEILLYVIGGHGLDDILKELGAESLEKDENGAPYLKGAPLHVSLSHKGNLVAFAVSWDAVGVDVEDTTVPRNVERLSKLFHIEEHPSSLYEFYRVWTAKEAEGKRLRTGITTDILRAKSPQGRYFDWGDHLICVMGQGDIRVIDRT